jgi:hypothetical protein
MTRGFRDSGSRPEAVFEEWAEHPDGDVSASVAEASRHLHSSFLARFHNSFAGVYSRRIDYARHYTDIRICVICVAQAKPKAR